MRLLTNLSYATVYPKGADGGVRTNTYALMLTPGEERESLFGKPAPATIRGLGTTASWPVFDLFLPVGVGIEYTTQSWESPSIIVGDATPEGRPIAQGDVLTFEDGTRIVLDVGDYERPITVDDVPAGEHDRLWRMLERRVASFWTAPNMPLPHYVPADQVRAALGQRA